MLWCRFSVEKLMSVQVVKIFSAVMDSEVYWSAHKILLLDTLLRQIKTTHATTERFGSQVLVLEQFVLQYSVHS
jgi:hypothetical protein